MLEFDPETKDKNEKKILRELPPQNTARLGPDLFLKGELSGNEDFIIDGQFQGKIDLKNHTLIIGREGKVEADIQAKNITINGNMKGNIFASGKVYISEEAQMDGNISASVISIMDGAQFKGSVKMEKGDKVITSPEKKAQGILALEEKETKDNTPSE